MTHLSGWVVFWGMSRTTSTRTTTVVQLPRNGILSVSQTATTSSQSISPASSSNSLQRQEYPVPPETETEGHPLPSRCFTCDCLLIDQTAVCPYCTHHGFAEAEASTVTTITETTEIVSQIRSTTVKGFYIGCGITRTLESCNNGHLRCRRCVLNCHDCNPKQRRGR